jgi:hypothetical protein
MSESLGLRLARAIADKDETALRGVLADDVDFRGLTPGRAWEASNPDEVVDIAFGHWFTESDGIVSDDVSEGEPVGDTSRVSYRLEIDNAAGEHVVEQQVYYRGAEGDAGRIGYARVVCSGYRPR